LLLVRFECDAKLRHHLQSTLNLIIHDHSSEHDDRLHDELDEGSLKFLTGTSSRIIHLKFLLFWVEVVVAPKLRHEDFSLDFELVRVDLGEFGEGKGPTKKCGTKSSGTFGWINLLVAHIIALVGGDDNIDVLNHTEERLVHGLTINLEFEDSAVNFIDHEDALDLLGKSLPKYSLGLDGHTFDVIDDNKCAVSNSERSSDFG